MILIVYPIVCVACFFIGVWCGKRAERIDRATDAGTEADVDIEHVTYDAAQLGREK